MKFVSNSFERDVFFLQDLALSYDLLQEEKLADRVVFDLSEVASVNDIGRRMVVQGFQGLRTAGRNVILKDPRKLFPELS